MTCWPVPLENQTTVVAMYTYMLDSGFRFSCREDSFMACKGLKALKLSLSSSNLQVVDYSDMQVRPGLEIWFVLGGPKL